jgi:hypothetical protein
MKYIYLDQLHWIHLAQAATGQTHGQPYSEALDAARCAVRDGRALVPLSCVHVVETAKPAKLRQRADLAHLMTELSRGTVLRRCRSLVRFQIGNAVRRMFGQAAVGPEPCPFGRGVEEAFGLDLAPLLGIPAHRAQALRQVLDSPAAWFDLLSCGHESERLAGINAVRRIGEQAVSEYERRRHALLGMRKDMPDRVYAALLTCTFQQELQECLAEIRRTLPEWARAGPDRLVEFWRDIPTLHVEMELHVEMQRQLSKAWTPNDDMDITCLSLAIPSCDVVATEAFWVDLAKRHSLHSRYNTVLIADLSQLSSLIG